MLRRAALIALCVTAFPGCTDRFGRVDYGRTALLGVGAGAAAALTAGALSDNSYGRRHHGYSGYGYGRAYSGYGNYGYRGYQPGYYGGGGYGYQGHRGYGGWAY